MKRLLLCLIVCLLFRLADAQVFSSLPTTWEDNNEATDGINCGGYCSGLGYPYPAYELQLGSTTGVWITGPPSGCTFALGSYVTTGAGYQAAINAIEACRTYGIAHSVNNCFILDRPPGVYSLSGGYTIPQTSTTPAPCFNIIRSTSDASLVAMPEPVCAGGMQDNLATSTNIGLINPDCLGDNLAYQLGITVFPISAGPFTLANGIVTNTSAYNYLQFMPQDICTSTNCVALQFGSGVGGTGIGPDRWLLEDAAVSMSAGNFGANDIVLTGNISGLTSTSQFASHIHFRRVWAHGDWSNLATGNNSISSAFALSACLHCTIVGSQVSQALRPGAEGHAVGINGSNYKIDNNWFEGESSCAFSGGFSLAAGPPIFAYVPFQNSEFRRNRCTFPFQWLGQDHVPNNNPYWGSAAAPWIVSPTMVTVASNGTTVTWSGGDPFHDANSSWPGNPVKINGISAAIQSMGTGTCPSSCPTTLTLKTAIAQQPTPVTFTMAIQSLVRKNCEEMKSGIAVVMDGNICENVDNSGGQSGAVMDFNIRNRSGGGQGQDYQAIISNLTFTNNIIRHACEGIVIAARSGSTPSNGGGVSYGVNGVTMSNNLQYDITTSGNIPECPTNHLGMQFASEGQTWQGTITASGGSATFVANCSQDLGGCLGQVASATITNAGSACTAGTLVISSPATGGDNAAASYTCSGSSLNAVTITDPGWWYTSSAPTVTGFSNTCTGCAVTLTLNTTPIQPQQGFEVMNIPTGYPISITGCTVVTSFNVATTNRGGSLNPNNVGPVASAGSAPWTGTFNVNGVTVTYPWATSGTDSAGFCTAVNVEGGPNNMLLSHMTFITDSNQTVGNGNTTTGHGPNFQMNHVFRDSLMLNSGGLSAGWYNSVIGEGTPTEQFNYDYHSMTVDHVVWPTRTSSKYTAYGNNSTIPVVSPTMSFPASDYCSASTYAGSGSNCIAFSGAMSLPSGPMPLTLNDYHGYVLRSDSPYHNTASDGTDFGANIAGIDAAQILNRYVCQSACGSGPFPDYTLGVNPVSAPAAAIFADNSTDSKETQSAAWRMKK